MLNENTEQQINQTGTMYGTILRAIENTIVNMVKADSDSRYKGSNVQLALQEINRQMIAAGVATASFDGNTITIGTLSADSGNKGNGTLVTHTSPSAIYGPAVTAFPAARTETLSLTCYKDAQDKSVRSGTEMFDVEGGTPYGNFDYRFPGGGGYYGRMPSICETLDSKMGVCQQHLMNGGFESVVSNVPVNWSIATGTAGSDVESETSSVFRGSKAIKITGDGSVQHKIQQNFASIGGTTSTLKPDTVYVIGAAVKRGGSAPSAGVLRFEIVDSGGTVLAAKSVNCRLEVTCSGLTASYVRKTATIRTPKDIPSSTTFRIYFSTALSNTHEVYIDSVVLAPLFQLNAGGIYVGVLAGSTDWAVDDMLDQPVTNNAEGEWLTELDRFFGMNESGLVLPVETDGSETVEDILIS
jgi:hypothetical protein